jgi:hypothetical protein
MTLPNYVAYWLYLMACLLAPRNDARMISLDSEILGNLCLSFKHPK